MAEFAPARLAREAQGSFADTMSAKPSCRAHGFGYFRRNESSPLANASGTAVECGTVRMHTLTRRCAPPSPEGRGQTTRCHRAPRSHVMNAVITKSNARITIEENTTVRVVEYATPSLVGGAV